VILDDSDDDFVGVYIRDSLSYDGSSTDYIVDLLEASDEYSSKLILAHSDIDMEEDDFFDEYDENALVKDFDTYFKSSFNKTNSIIANLQYISKKNKNSSFINQFSKFVIKNKNNAINSSLVDFKYSSTVKKFSTTPRTDIKFDKYKSDGNYSSFDVFDFYSSKESIDEVWPDLDLDYIFSFNEDDYDEEVYSR
jgi:hypothetical protein